MDLNIGDRVAIVAGSSRGIGLACASRLHAEGASVAITGRTGEALNLAVRTISDTDHSRLLSIQEDLTSSAGIGSALTATMDRFGRLDIVVGCIGSGRGHPGWEQGADRWENSFEQNLWPAIRLCESAVPLMSPDSAIILVGSIAARERLGPIPYGTAKAALAAYSTRLAAEVAALGIRVLCIEPGNVLVPGGRWAERLQDEPKAVEAMLERDTLQKRLGTPEEIADVVTFLASPRASFMTATRIVVDGGQTHD